jgi:hypothetical protein
MTTSIGTIAQQALRRLGVRIVPLDDSPTLTEMVPVADIAAAALEELGVLTGGSAASGAIVTPTAIATSALVDLGVLNSDLTLAVPATVPQATIATAALTELGVIASDETPSTADQALAVDKVASVHGALVDQGIALWDVSAIPRAFAEEYTKLTAAMSASSFGKTVDPAIVALLEGRVRTGAQVLNADPAFMLDMVLRVHDGLAAQGIASWASTAIPHAFAEEYTKLTAGYAAAAFGKAIDPQVVALLEGRVRAGATVLNADMPFMLGKVASVHASLDAQGVVWWDGTAVPRAFVEEYTKLTAAYAAASLGQKTDPAMIPLLEARVRKGAMVLSADDNAQQAVQAVHDDLVMRGITRWTVFDVPDAVGPQYAVLAADRLAPLFGMDTDAKDTALAMVAIYRYIALPSSGEVVSAAYF